MRGHCCLTVPVVAGISTMRLRGGCRRHGGRVGVGREAAEHLALFRVSRTAWDLHGHG